MSDRTEVNRQNAALSTGPRTAKGKVVVSRNAVKHGAFAALPVIPGVESEEDWQAHRAGVLDSLAPVGALETRLGERVALLLWRLERVARYETAVTWVGLDEAADPPAAPSSSSLLDSLNTDPDDASTLEKATKKLAKQREALSDAEAAMGVVEKLPGLPDEAPLSGDDAYLALVAFTNALPDDADAPDILDEEFLRAFGVPAGDDFDEVKWTAGLVRRAIAFTAKQGKVTTNKLAERATRDQLARRDKLAEEVRELAGIVRDHQRKRKQQLERTQARRMLPETNAEGKVMRYEAHLNRQLFQTLHELERIQASRAGRHVPLPLAVDVGVEVSSADG